MKKAFVLTLFLFCYISALAQADFLIVYKSGNSHRYYYHIGDFIQLKPLNDFPTRKGFISKLSDSAIYFGHDDSVMFNEIDYIFLGKKKGLFPDKLWLYNLASTSVIALFYEAPYLINGETSPFFRSTLGVIGVITVVPVVTNVIVKSFRKDRLSLRPDEWQIATISPA